MVMNISCKFVKASYNTFFVSAVMVKSLYTLRRRGCGHNKAKSIVSTGCYPLDTIFYTFGNSRHVLQNYVHVVLNVGYPNTNPDLSNLMGATKTQNV